jgi:hypothetical protein
MVRATEGPPAALEWLARNRLPSAYALLGFGVIMVALGGYAAYQLGIQYWEVWSAAFLVAAISFGAGLWQLLRQERPAAELDLNRMLVLSVGGLWGFTATLLGARLARIWWTSYLVTWLKVGEGQDLWRLLLVMISLLGGLALMFVSLQLGRTEERYNPGLRRLVYGYNAVLAGLLLLAVLALANVFIYLKLPQTLDFTTSSLFTLSTESESLLRALDKPVQVKAVLRSNNFNPQIKDLLDRCQAINDKFSWELLSPDLNPTKVGALAEKYLLEQEGLLVLYGPENPKAESRFIKESDLFGQSRPGEPAGELFKGEDLLMTEVSALLEGKKPVIYITQGNGELELQDDQLRGPDTGAGVLKRQLEGRNYEIKPLLFSPAEAKVPDDASAVVLLGPRNGLPDFALKALENYLNPSDPKQEPGKLVVLLNSPATKAMADRQKSLLDYLSRFQVQTLNDRVLSFMSYKGSGDPSRILVLPYPREDNPFLKPFENTEFVFKNVLAFQPGAPGQNPMGPRYRVTPLLVCRPGQGIFLYSDLEAEPNRALDDFVKDRKNPPPGLVLLPLDRVPLVALAVSSVDARDPHAGVMGAPVAAKPTLVVIGDATLVSNRALAGAGGEENFSLLTSSLGWLRERTGSIGRPPKQRNYYTLKPSASLYDITMIPTAMMLVGIVGLGAGVWVVRRR